MTYPLLIVINFKIEIPEGFWDGRSAFELKMYGEPDRLDQISVWKSIGQSSVCQHLANERVDWMSGGGWEERKSGQIGVGVWDLS